MTGGKRANGRRVGELLKELQRATAAEAASLGGLAKAAASNGGTWQQDEPAASPYAKALTDNGISRQSASRSDVLEAPG